MARRPAVETEDYVSLAERNLEEITPAGFIPNGVWLLRCTGMKIDKKVDEKDDHIYELVTMTHEPVEATDTVDPDEVAEVNSVTGKLTYDGRRIFSKFFVHNDNDFQQVKRVLAAHGIEGGSVKAAMTQIKGAMAYGEVHVRTFKTSAGEDGKDNAVRNWAALDA